MYQYSKFTGDQVELIETYFSPQGYYLVKTVEQEEIQETKSFMLTG